MVCTKNLVTTLTYPQTPSAAASTVFANCYAIVCSADTVMSPFFRQGTAERSKTQHISVEFRFTVYPSHFCNTATANGFKWLL